MSIISTAAACASWISGPYAHPERLRGCATRLPARILAGFSFSRSAITSSRQATKCCPGPENSALPGSNELHWCCLANASEHLRMLGAMQCPARRVGYIARTSQTHKKVRLCRRHRAAVQKACSVYIVGCPPRESPARACWLPASKDVTD